MQIGSQGVFGLKKKASPDECTGYILPKDLAITLELALVPYPCTLEARCKQVLGR